MWMIRMWTGRRVGELRNKVKVTPEKFMKTQRREGEV
jgi:hypothetical protein